VLQNTDEIQGKQNVQEIDAAKCAGVILNAQCPIKEQ